MTTETDGRAAYPAWRPIETAPKDEARLLLFRGDSVSIGWHDPERFHKNPRPFWNSSGAVGRRWCQDHPPTHWMPLPLPPSAARDKETRHG